MIAPLDSSARCNSSPPRQSCVVPKEERGRSLAGWTSLKGPLGPEPQIALF